MTNRIADTYNAASAADAAFEAALKAHGYRSRWDWERRDGTQPELEAAYRAKITADLAHHEAWTATHGEPDVDAMGDAPGALIE